MLMVKTGAKQRLPADHALETALVVNNRQSFEPLFDHQTDSVFDAGLIPDGWHIGTHDFTGGGVRRYLQFLRDFRMQGVAELGEQRAEPGRFGQEEAQQVAVGYHPDEGSFRIDHCDLLDIVAADELENGVNGGFR